MEIENISLYTALNSRSNKTVAAEINGEMAFAPSGASAGSHEASAFVPEEIESLEQELKERVEGKSFSQEEFDSVLKEIDGTDNFDRIGSIGIAASLAYKMAEGYDKKPVFPYPLGNVVGGGEHGGNTAIQEFLVLPVEAESFIEAVEINSAVYHELKEKHARKIMGMNDEGALITKMDDEETLKALHKVAEKHGAKIGLDVAANEIFKDGKYRYPQMNMELNPKQQLKFMKKLIDKYDLYYVEDPFHEDDFESHKKLTVETECLIVGDDLFVTNRERLERGIEENSCNALIVKPNQVGSVTGTYQTLEKAFQNDYAPAVSHRSGETCDTNISEIALEKEAPILKAGIADIRTAKLNKLMLEWQKMEEKGIEPEMAELPYLKD